MGNGWGGVQSICLDYLEGKVVSVEKVVVEKELVVCEVCEADVLRSRSVRSEKWP